MPLSNDVYKKQKKTETYLPSRLVTEEDYDRNLPKTIFSNHLNSRQNSKNQLYIATYNVRTLSSYERVIELREAVMNIKYDIIGISEVRRSGNKISEYEDFILCYTGQTPGKYGVGFIIKKYLKQYVESYIGISE